MTRHVLGTKYPPMPHLSTWQHVDIRERFQDTLWDMPVGLSYNQINFCTVEERELIWRKQIGVAFIGAVVLSVIRLVTGSMFNDEYRQAVHAEESSPLHAAGIDEAIECGSTSSPVPCAIEERASVSSS